MSQPAPRSLLCSLLQSLCLSLQEGRDTEGGGGGELGPSTIAAEAGSVTGAKWYHEGGRNMGFNTLRLALRR